MYHQKGDHGALARRHVVNKSFRARGKQFMIDKEEVSFIIKFPSKYLIVGIIKEAFTC